MSPGPSGLTRAFEQSVVRHAQSLRCENATWVTAQTAVPEAVTRARHIQQCWVSCPELPGPSGLMRASERSQRRPLLLGKAMRGITEPLFPWHDQPREERALRGGRALNVRELRPRGRQSRGTTRAHKLLVHVPAALCGCWDPSYWWTYQRHCGMLGPAILVFVPAALCERWAQGVRSKSGHPPQGDQPEDWRAPSQRTAIKSGITAAIFLTRQVPSSLSRWSSTRCRRTWYNSLG